MRTLDRIGEWASTAVLASAIGYFASHVVVAWICGSFRVVVLP